jgi:hypothetical protein
MEKNISELINGDQDVLPTTEAKEPELNDYEICKNLIRAVVNIRLDFEQAKAMVGLMKELRKRPLQSNQSSQDKRKKRYKKKKNDFSFSTKRKTRMINKEEKNEKKCTEIRV